MSGTAAWLSRWTAPLLDSNPLTWVLHYALGFALPNHRDYSSFHADDENTVEFDGTPEGPSSTVSAIMASFDDGVRDSAAENEDSFGDSLAGVFFGKVDGVSVYRPLLVVGWAMALAVVVPVVPWFVKRFSLSTIAGRKVFHALATVMFVPGIALEVRTYLRAFPFENCRTLLKTYPCVSIFLY